MALEARLVDPEEAALAQMVEGLELGEGDGEGGWVGDELDLD